MRAVVYAKAGDPDVLRIVERDKPEPGLGDVRVAVHVSGVNPTDWKQRRRTDPTGDQVPNQDGAGVIDAVGQGVDPARVGERVWLWEAAWHRENGTAAEFVVLPSRQAVTLPDGAPFDLGASIGIPVLTAHRCLTVGDCGPVRLGPGGLHGNTVLVAGGAGAVGNAAIQLARWAGATVVTTVSSEEKGQLATAAGAHHVINYRDGETAKAIRAVAPDGIDIVVEVDLTANALINADVLAPNGVVAFYATGSQNPTMPLDRVFALNVRWQGVLIYSIPETAKEHAVQATVDAIAAGGFRVGESAGLPLHRFPLARTGDAHQAVEDRAIGKVLIDVV